MMNRIVLLLAAVMMSVLYIHAQELDQIAAGEDEHVFSSVESMPQFPGGDAALLKYVSTHVHYPSHVNNNEFISGRVTVQFVVTKTGQVGKVKVMRSLAPAFDQEAIRVVKSLPKFQPGRQNGKAVDVWYTLPVKFSSNH